MDHRSSGEIEKVQKKEISPVNHHIRETTFEYLQSCFPVVQEVTNFRESDSNGYPKRFSKSYPNRAVVYDSSVQLQVQTIIYERNLV